MEQGKLNDRQAAFVREYVKDWNATQAYIRAGYSAKSEAALNAGASTLLRNPKITAAIEAQRVAVGEYAKVESKELIDRMRIHAFRDRRSVMSWTAKGVILKDSSELTPEDAALIVEVSETINQAGFRSIRVKMVDPQRALEQLQKYDKNFSERREHSGPAGKAIEVTTKTWLEAMLEDDGTK